MYKRQVPLYSKDYYAKWSKIYWVCLLYTSALFVSYAQAVGLFESGINLLDYKVIVGMFVGGMLPFLFSAFTMDSVSKAAYKMIEEVRRQFKTIPGILEGKGKPDYTSCVAISTQAALKEMLLPGVMAVLAPLFIGVVLGPAALGGLLGGALVTGVMLAIFMSNSGGAWDNAKKYIEDGNHGGKGSEAHRASVVGLSLIHIFIAGIFNSIFFVKSKELNEQSVKIFCSGTNKNLFRLDMHSPELF